MHASDECACKSRQIRKRVYDAPFSDHPLRGLEIYDDCSLNSKDQGTSRELQAQVGVTQGTHVRAKHLCTEEGFKTKRVEREARYVEPRLQTGRCLNFSCS
jgi:hypothetical protein